MPYFNEAPSPVIAEQIITFRPTSRGGRLWIEGDRLTSVGFTKGSHYLRTDGSGCITLILDAEGKRKVSGKAKPIIDISAKSLDGFAIGQECLVEYRLGSITITAM